MKNNDRTLKYSSRDNTLQLISSVTDVAPADRKFEGHAHYDELEIYYFIEGKLDFAFEGSKYPVSDGTVIIIANGTLHRPIIKAPCRYSRKRILFDKRIFLSYGASAIDFYATLRKRKILFLTGEEAKALKPQEYFFAIERALSAGTPHEDFCALIALYSLLLNAEKLSSTAVISNQASAEGRIEQIIRYIEDNLTYDLSYKAVAKIFFISEKSLYKFFKKETGFTLSNYVTERRIIRAQAILSSGRTAKEAAHEAGFSDYSVFYRNFSKKVGVPPTEYAKKSLNNVYQQGFQP